MLFSQYLHRNSLVQRAMTPILDRITSQPGRAIEADKRMVARLDLTSRILFLFTNLPYWVVFIAAVVNAVECAEFEPERWERHRGVVMRYASIARRRPFLRSYRINSHAHIPDEARWLYMRMCLQCKVEVAETIHSPNLLKKLKALDSSRALTAVLTLGTCHGWRQVLDFFAFAFPVFMLGLFSKRFNYHYTYITLHGLWHFLTAFLAWKALLRR